MDRNLTKENILKEFNRLSGGIDGIFLEFVAEYDRSNNEHKKYIACSNIDDVIHTLCQVYEDGNYKYYCIKVAPAKYGETLLMQTRSHLTDSEWMEQSKILST